MKLILFLFFYILNTGAKEINKNYGSALFLTSYLKKGDFEEARNLSKVPEASFKGNMDSYAGLFSVNDVHSSIIFFWYFPMKNGSNNPLVVWLPPTPGDSALVSILEENGPFYIKPKRGMNTRQHYLSQVVNVLYLDSPVGKGFRNITFPKNPTDIGNNLFDCLSQFFQLFPEMKTNKLFVGGEYFASKQVILLATKIHTEKSSVKLTGIIIGNGFWDPLNQLSLTKSYLNSGLLDIRNKDTFFTEEHDIINLIKEKKYSEAFYRYDKFILGALTQYPTYVKNFTHLDNYGYTCGLSQAMHGKIESYLEEKDIFRRSIHVGSTNYNEGINSIEAFKDYWMTSETDNLKILMSNYKSLFYFGQQSVEVPVFTGTEALRRVEWCGSRYRLSLRRIPWRENDKLVGYVTRVSVRSCVGELTEVVVRNAARSIFSDQPSTALRLIENFVYDKNF